MHPESPHPHGADPAAELTGALRKAVERINATPMPQPTASQAIDRAAALSRQKAAPGRGRTGPGGVHVLAWVVAAASVAFVTIGTGVAFVWFGGLPQYDGAVAPEAASRSIPDNARKDMPPKNQPPVVKVVRLPQGGTHPRAVLKKGVLHLVYFAGDPEAGDVIYLRSLDDGATYSPPQRLNGRPGSAALDDAGTGPQFGVDETGRVHVIWTGADAVSVWYTRRSVDDAEFEPARNLRRQVGGRVGGAGVAADVNRLLVFWHAPGPPDQGAARRRVWSAQSLNDGKDFTAEAAVSPPDVEVWDNCPTCALMTYPHMPVFLFRGGTDRDRRDLYLLHEDRKAIGGPTPRFHAVTVHPWRTEARARVACALLDLNEGYLAAWETAGQVYYSWARHLTANFAPAVSPPGPAGKRKLPALASDGRDTALVWVEGDAGGRATVCWQLFDRSGRPAPERGMVTDRHVEGRIAGQRLVPERDGTPSGPVAVVPYQGRFVIIY
jgi:hypothetical protein